MRAHRVWNVLDAFRATALADQLVLVVGSPACDKLGIGGHAK